MAGKGEARRGGKKGRKKGRQLKSPSHMRYNAKHGWLPTMRKPRSKMRRIAFGLLGPKRAGGTSVLEAFEEIRSPQNMAGTRDPLLGRRICACCDPRKLEWRKLGGLKWRNV